jgi:hypothetical protein
LPASGLTAAVFEVVAGALEAHLLGERCPGHRRLHARSRHHDAGARDLVAVALGHRLGPLDQRLAVLRERSRIEAGFLDVVEIDLGLQAHEVHRDQEQLVVVLRVARHLQREFGEVGELEAGLRRHVVERHDDAVVRPTARAVPRCPSRSRAPLPVAAAARTFGDVLLLRDHLHLDLHALVLWASLKLSIIFCQTSPSEAESQLQ